MEASRVLDARLGELPPDAEVGVVVKAIVEVFSDLHLSVWVKKHEKSLETNGYGTVGGLMTLDAEDLVLLGVSQGHAKLKLVSAFASAVRVSSADADSVRFSRLTLLVVATKESERPRVL